MKQYSTFIFESYNFNPETAVVSLKYSLDDEVRFEEKLILPKQSIINYQLSTLNNALFALHLIGGISYYKTCLPKKIEVRSGTLDEDQAAFWNTVYTKGLAEFFYRNAIDPTGLIDFPSSDENYELQIADNESEIRNPKSEILVPIGGGKDSMITAELLKDAGIDFTFFRMGHHPVIEKLASIAGKPLLMIERRLDPQLFKLNTEGALNGHIPITGYLSFVTVLVSLLYGFDAVAMSNERSANFGNVTHHDIDVNHQWSKSLEFERLFQNYLRHYVTRDVSCFSLLRQMSELTITQLFCLHPEYFGTATSCNTNWRLVGNGGAMNPTSKTRRGSWCCECPKCAFVFSQMAAFLPAKTLTEIFGKNLFGDETLMPLYKELLGMEGLKPFECVGTPEEVCAAFLLALRNEGWEDTPIIQMFLAEMAPTIDDPKRLIVDVLALSDDHAIPPQFLSLL